MDEAGDCQHVHCATCIKAYCKEVPSSTACPQITCELDCGFRFHTCKLDEHVELCENQRVPCINRVSGCPLEMPRRELSAHLEICPASVMQCMMEWNRWPVYSTERQSRVPFVQDNIHARYGQLDVALALRDQRELNQAMKVPKSTRRVLRNNLTQRYPAVPLCPPQPTPPKWDNPLKQTGDTSQTETMSDDDSDAPWQVNKQPPGLQSSMCQELFRNNQPNKGGSAAAGESSQESQQECQAIATAQDEADVVFHSSHEGTPETGLPSHSEEAVGSNNQVNEASVNASLADLWHALEQSGHAAIATSVSTSGGSRKPRTNSSNADCSLAVVSHDPHLPQTVRSDTLQHPDTRYDSQIMREKQDFQDQQSQGAESHEIMAHRSEDSEINWRDSQNTYINKKLAYMESTVVSETQSSDFNQSDETRRFNLKEDVGDNAHINLKIRLSDSDSTSPEAHHAKKSSNPSPACILPPGDEQGHTPVNIAPHISSKDGAVYRDTERSAGTGYQIAVNIDATVSESNTDTLGPSMPTSAPTDGEVHSAEDSVPTSAPTDGEVQTGEGSVPEPPGPPLSLKLKEILALDLNIESITRYQIKPKSMYTFLCAQNFRRDEYPWHFKNVHNDIHAGLNGWLEQRCPLAHYGCTYSLRRFHPTEKGAQVIYNPLLESYGVHPGSSDRNGSHSPTGPDSAQEMVANNNVAHISRAKSKESTPEIYTSKDYNSDIKVNGNIQKVKAKHECGDMDSVTVVNVVDGPPTVNTDGELCDPPENAVEYGDLTGTNLSQDLQTISSGAESTDYTGNIPILNSDSVIDSEDVIHDGSCQQNYTHTICTQGRDDSILVEDTENKLEVSASHIKLDALPFEILQHVCHFLDGFALCNLALTNRLLRQVCCSLLDEKGIVIPVWEREQRDGHICWTVAYKKWLFSSSFSPVHRWVFQDQPHMSEHLRRCPFYHTEIKLEPMALLQGNSCHCRAPDFLHNMRRMYPGFTPVSEHITPLTQ